jgi:hypothetical protein
MRVSFDVVLATDPRVEKAGFAALALHFAAASYCAQHLTDGVVPRTVARRLLSLGDPDAIAQRLVNAGVWEELGDSWHLIDYLAANPSRAQVLALRAKRAAAGRRGGLKSGSRRASKGKSTSRASGKANASSVGSNNSNQVQSLRTGQRCPNGVLVAADGGCCGRQHAEAAS